MFDNPIIFIPGIFGSMGNDIIPGTGEFDFGIAEYAYRPLIKNLEDMGYKEGKNLFIAYYDWTKNNIYSAEKYLIPVIRKAKEITGKHKVNIICHSMGGIVARAYIQTHLYNHDIQKLIMLGTPNLGALNSYYFWSGGELPYEKIEKNIFYRLLKAGFLWLFKLKYGQRCDLEISRKLFPVVEELLPCYKYGNYVILKENNSNDKYIPIEKMSIRNDLLNKLNKKNYLFYRYGIRTHSIIGTGIQTNSIVYVKDSDRNCNIWKDGEPLYSGKTIYGDGTVTCNSARGFSHKATYISSDHMNILEDSKEAIADILKRNFERNSNHIKNNSANQLYSILADNLSEMNITIDNKELTISRDIFTVNDSYIARKVGKNTYWIMISPASKNIIDLKIYPKAGKKSKVVILSGEENKTITKIKEGTIVNKLIMTL